MILKERLKFVVRCSSDNSFTNKVYGMQKAGMNVSGVTPPVTNKTSSKDLIKITGYTKEDGLLATTVGGVPANHGATAG